MGGMTRLLLLLLWVGVTVGTAVDLQKRIINGHDCLQTERQYHVRFVDSENRLICGGSLISEKWILTAAHCWSWGMRADVGVHPLQRQAAPPVVITAPPVIFTHKKKMHDIMLVELPNSVQIEPVRLPDTHDCENIPNRLQIAGHGPTAVDPITKIRVLNSTTHILKCADIDQVLDCIGVHILGNDASLHQLHGDNHWICGRTCGYSGVDIAPGDSGGGVVKDNTIYGVISLMIDGDEACVKPAVFTNVCKYMQWIKKTVPIGAFNKFKTFIKG